MQLSGDPKKVVKAKLGFFGGLEECVRISHPKKLREAVFK